MAAGSAVGTDNWFPVRPFRMYARATSPDAAVTILNVEAVTVGGEVIPLKTDQVLGLRRAELEGQAPEIRADPGMLGVLAREYRRAAPDTPPLVEVRLVGTRVELEGGRAVGEPTTRVQVVWTVDP